MPLTIFGIPGLPEIIPGTDLAASIFEAARDSGSPLESGDILVITSKIVSKAEGRIVRLEDVQVSPSLASTPNARRRNRRSLSSSSRIETSRPPGRSDHDHRDPPRLYLR